MGNKLLCQDEINIQIILDQIRHLGDGKSENIANEIVRIKDLMVESYDTTSIYDIQSLKNAYWFLTQIEDMFRQLTIVPEPILME